MTMTMNQWVQAYLALDSATIYEASGQEGALDSAIKAIAPGHKVCGPAYTVRCHVGDNLAIHRALSDVEPGQVLVVDARAYTDVGYWGEVMTAAAIGRKVAGLVIDGGVRDIAAIAARGFPVFARGVCIKGTQKAAPGEVRQPIICGGVQVRTGDLVLGDEDGVVVVAQQRLADVLAKSEARVKAEQQMMALLETGKATTVELLVLAERLGLQPGRRGPG